ncbi:MAG: 50S ribosomal protein L22 [Puniceicoccales bacterium]|jgi:large subunit ribosomal protein L22|nr:50S ribosomal protein L22 [Puniceicoccales bacterium]
MGEVYRTVWRHAKSSPLKLRQIARLLRGKSASDGRDFLRCIPRKSAQLIGKVLNSAIANMENNEGLPIERLRIENVIIEEGRSLRRYVPAARGSAHPIRKYTSHINVILIKG